MDAIEYLKIKKTMCHFFNRCSNCPLRHLLGDCDYMEEHNPEDAIRLIQEWKDTHPNCKV